MQTNKGVTRLSVALLAALLAVGCSGGGSGELLDLGPDAPGEDLSSVEGRWSDIMDWPMVPIHVVLLPDGRVLSYGSTKGGDGVAITGGLQYDLWTPDAPAGTPAHQTLKNFTATDIFCNAQLVLPQPDAGVLLVGGDTFPRREPSPDPDPEDELDVPENNDNGNSDALVLDYLPDEPRLTQQTGMRRGRWYGTATTLANGEVYVQGGRSFSLVSGEDHPEIRGVSGAFRLLEGADTSPLRYYYPRNFVMPDSSLFGFDTRGVMYRVDTAGAGSVTVLNRFAAEFRGDESTAAMFRPGRILQFGSNSLENSFESPSLIIDANSPTPTLTPSGDLSSLRRYGTATLLPDGRVLATGGSAVDNENRGVNLAAEIWDPVTGVWTLGAEAQNPRLYHSSALLLADGSVLVGGGGLPGPDAFLDAERYYPPYLFTATGARAPRPRLGGPDSLQVGRRFALTYSAASGTAGTADAARVTLVKTGSMTHNWNMEQRFIELPFTVTGAFSLDVRMPSRAGEVPPGYYLLFVINRAGVPSEGKSVFINVAGAAEPAEDPTLVAPDNRTVTVGSPTSLQLSGTDPNGTAISYAAAGLPTGLSLNAAGLISGTPTAAGGYDVVVSASDGTRTASANFVWTVAEAAAP